MGSKDRLKVNSQNLRQKFPNYYEDLFSSCQIVFSASDSYFWAGEYARFYGGLTILQKLPTKNYIGLEVTNEPKISFANLWGFNPSLNDFEMISYDYAKELRLVNFLNYFWPTLDPERKIKGFKIHLLSESHCGGGLGTTGVDMACLAAALLMLAGKLTSDQVDEWRKTPVNLLINDAKYEKFRDVFYLAWRMTAICRDGNSSGATSFAALIETPFPIVYFSENINKFISDSDFCNTSNKENQCKKIEDLHFWGSRFEELFPIRVPQPWPIDIGRVYSGSLINTENIFKSLSQIKTEIEDLRKNVREEIGKKIQTDQLNIDYIFGKDEQKSRSCTFQDYLDIFDILSGELLLSLRDIFIQGPNEDILRKFFQILHKMQDYSHFLGHSTNLLDEICQRLANVASSENEFNLASAKIEGIGKGGHVLFMMPSGVTFDKVMKETENLSGKTNKNIYLDWASWLDGFGKDGLVLEQCLTQNYFSPFVSRKHYQLTTIAGETFHTKIINMNDLEKVIQKNILTLVVPENKIYVCGTPLTSKDIPSAKTTLDLMRKILHSDNYKISNDQFNESSYGQNRYDLQSKIFIPLAKTLEKRAGKKLEFHISGGMYDNYSVSLNIDGITISLIEAL